MLGRATEMVGWRVAWVLCWVVGSWTVAAAAQDTTPPRSGPPTLAAPANVASEKPVESPVLLAAENATPPPPVAEGAAAPANPAPAGAVAAPPPAPGAEQAQPGVEVLTRGPVHEAFAEPLAGQPEAGMIVAKKPPADIEEVPPDLKPEGDSIIWVPGYWAWDDDRKDFLWVSGIWRNLPPGRRWVPGYWTEAQGGFQWVSGLWVPAQQEELEYREAPPQTVEAGPSSPAPSENHFWVPGNWLWYETGYRWRAGFWSPYQDDWVWVAAHWAWTPSGYVFVPGYWDYRVAHRGRLFAPVYFAPTVWSRPGFYYSPWCTLDVGPLFMHFWIRPRYRHYYFGDYYGPAYLTAGFTPWARWHSHPHHWDPLLTHNHHYYRRHEHFDYVNRMQQWHSYYDKHHDFRPPHTYHDQMQFMAKHHGKPPAGVSLSVMGVPLATIAKRPDSHDRFVHVDKTHKDSFRKEAEQLRHLTKERAGMEKHAFTGMHPGSKIGPSGGIKPGFGDLSKTKPGAGTKTDIAGPRRPGGKMTLPKVSGMTAAAAAKVVTQPKTGTFPKMNTDSRLGTQPKVTTDSRLGTFPKMNTDSRLGTQPKVTTDSRLGTQPKVTTDSRLGTQPKVTTDSRLGTQPKVTTDSRLGTQPKVTTQPKTGTFPKVTPQFKTETQPKVNTPPKTGTFPKVTTQFKTETQPKVTTQPRTGTFPKVTTQFKTETQPKVTTQPKTGTQPRDTSRSSSGFRQPSSQPKVETPRSSGVRSRDSGSSRSGTTSSRGRDNDDSRSKSDRRRDRN